MFIIKCTGTILRSDIQNALHDTLARSKLYQQCNGKGEHCDAAVEHLCIGDKADLGPCEVGGGFNGLLGAGWGDAEARRGLAFVGADGGCDGRKGHRDEKGDGHVANGSGRIGNAGGWWRVGDEGVASIRYLMLSVSDILSEESPQIKGGRVRGVEIGGAYSGLQYRMRLRCSTL